MTSPKIELSHNLIDKDIQSMLAKLIENSLLKEDYKADLHSHIWEIIDQYIGSGPIIV